MNMKKYENPMLQIVSIKKDIVTASIAIGDSYKTGDAVLDGGRRFDDWDAGY